MIEPNYVLPSERPVNPTGKGMELNFMAKQRYLTLEDRLQIAKYLSEGCSVTDIAEKLSISRATIYNELKRAGSSVKENNYDPVAAHSIREENSKVKRRIPTIEQNPELAEYIAYLIKKKHCGCTTIIKELEKSRFKGLVTSHNTILKAIRDGLIPGVTVDTMDNITKMFSNGLLRIPGKIMEKEHFQDGDFFSIVIDGDRIIFEKV